MKSAAFTFDRRLHDLLQDPGLAKFTTAELRDAYAASLDSESFRLADLRLYVYEQIRRLVRVGWVTTDGERRSRGQRYQVLSAPQHLQVELVTGSFESSLADAPEVRKEALAGTAAKVAANRSDQDLDRLHKETRMDFLSSMGEAECFKKLLKEMPHLHHLLESQYMEARDRSSRLLGHLRAIEKTLKTLARP